MKKFQWLLLADRSARIYLRSVTSGSIVFYRITATSRFWTCHTISWMVLCQALLCLLPPPPYPIENLLSPIPLGSPDTQATIHGNFLPSLTFVLFACEHVAFYTKQHFCAFSFPEPALSTVECSRMFSVFWRIQYLLFSFECSSESIDCEQKSLDFEGQTWNFEFLMTPLKRVKLWGVV